MIYSCQDALTDTREPLGTRAEYLLDYALAQRERYASMMRRTQLLIEMGANALPLDLDVQAPRAELLSTIERAVRLNDEARAAQRNSDAAFSRILRGQAF